MRMIHERCCGLDVHKASVVACLRTPRPDGGRNSEVRTFGTTTSELLRLADWLLEAGCVVVAMESTGEYWKPVYNILEQSCEQILLINPAHVKRLPGRKTDVKDCEWIAELLEHGLLKGSLIPPPPIRDLRDLTRYRKSLVQARSSEVNRLQKILETANVKLGNVASDVMGVSGRSMIEALIGGERNTELLAGLARGRLRKKQAELVAALTGRFRDHHAFLLGQILAHVDELDAHIDECGSRIEELLRPFEKELTLLKTIPGVGDHTAQVIFVEIGGDVRCFPSAGHLASWAGMCPGHHESAGKHKSGRTRKANRWLRQALIEAGWAASRARKSYLSAKYHSIARRRGSKRAVVAVGHDILCSAWYMLRDGVRYQDLGRDHLDRLHAERLTRYHRRRLEQLGYTVDLHPVEKDAA